MSISNSEAGGAPFDPALIARLANDLFTALPGPAGPPPGSGIASAPPTTPPVEVGALPVAPTIPPSSAVGNLTGTELRSAPATVSGATLRPPQAGFTPVLGPYEFRPELIPDAGFLTLPDGGIAATPPVTPPVEMGMLSAAPTVTPASAVAPPTEAELRALPASLGETPVPPSPDGHVPTAGGMPGSSYYFLDAVQAPPSPAAPALPQSDYGFDPAMLPDLGFLAGPYDPCGDRRDFPV